MFDLNVLTIWQVILSLTIGLILGCIYLFLLWKTLLKLPKIKHKGNFLFISAVIRICLLIFGALYFSFGNAAAFLLIFIGFVLSRLIVLKYVKASIQKEYQKHKADKKAKGNKK